MKCKNSPPFGRLRVNSRNLWIFSELIENKRFNKKKRNLPTIFRAPSKELSRPKTMSRRIPSTWNRLGEKF